MPRGAIHPGEHLAEQLELIRGSRNIYWDPNTADTDARQLKAILAAKIIKTLDKKDLSVRKAQSVTGIDAGDFSRVPNADFRRICELKFKVRHPGPTNKSITGTTGHNLVLVLVPADGLWSWRRFRRKV